MLTILQIDIAIAWLAFLGAAVYPKLPWWVWGFFVMVAISIGLAGIPLK
jgi:hypothetical protein